MYPSQKCHTVKLVGSSEGDVIAEAGTQQTSLVKIPWATDG